MFALEVHKAYLSTLFESSSIPCTLPFNLISIYKLFVQEVSDAASSALGNLYPLGMWTSSCFLLEY